MTLEFLDQVGHVEAYEDVKITSRSAVVRQIILSQIFAESRALSEANEKILEKFPILAVTESNGFNYKVVPKLGRS